MYNSRAANYESTLCVKYLINLASLISPAKAGSFINNERFTQRTKHNHHFVLRTTLTWNAQDKFNAAYHSYLTNDYIY